MLKSCNFRKTETQKENIWNRVNECAEKKNIMNDGIELACNRHPEYIKYISPGETPNQTAKSFTQVTNKLTSILFDCERQAPAPIGFT